MISEKAESRGQISAQPLKGDTVTVSQSRSGRLSLKPPSEKYLRKVRLKNIFPRKMIRLSGRIIIIYWVSSDTPQLWGFYREKYEESYHQDGPTYYSAASVSRGRQPGEHGDEG